MNHINSNLCNTIVFLFPPPLLQFVFLLILFIYVLFNICILIFVVFFFLLANGELH